MIGKITLGKRALSFLGIATGVLSLTFVILITAAHDLSRPVPFDAPVLGATMEWLEPSSITAALNDRTTHSLYDYDWVNNDDPVALMNRHEADATAAHEVYMGLFSPVFFSIEVREIKKIDTVSKRTGDADMSEYSVSDATEEYVVPLLEGYKILKESQDGQHFLVILPEDHLISGGTIFYVSRSAMLNIIRSFTYNQRVFNRAKAHHDQFAAQDKLRVERDISSMR